MDSVYLAKLSSKGQLFLPRELREELELQAGDVLELQAFQGRLLIAEKRSPSTFEQAVRKMERELAGEQLDAGRLARMLADVKREFLAETREEERA